MSVWYRTVVSNSHSTLLPRISLKSWYWMGMMVKELSTCKSWRVITRLHHTHASYFSFTFNVSSLINRRLSSVMKRRLDKILNELNEWNQESKLCTKREWEEQWMSQWQWLATRDKWDDCANWERKDIVPVKRMPEWFKFMALINLHYSQREMRHFSLLYTVPLTTIMIMGMVAVVFCHH